jgi:hypothetical protein
MRAVQARGPRASIGPSNGVRNSVRTGATRRDSLLALGGAAVLGSGIVSRGAAADDVGAYGFSLPQASERARWPVTTGEPRPGDADGDGTRAPSAAIARPNFPPFSPPRRPPPPQYESEVPLAERYAGKVVVLVNVASA